VTQRTGQQTCKTGTGPGPVTWFRDTLETGMQKGIPGQIRHMKPCAGKPRKRLESRCKDGEVSPTIRGTYRASYYLRTVASTLVMLNPIQVRPVHNDPISLRSLGSRSQLVAVICNYTKVIFQETGIKPSKTRRFGSTSCFPRLRYALHTEILSNTNLNEGFHSQGCLSGRRRRHAGLDSVEGT